MTAVLLGPGAEFDRIRAIAAALGPAARGLGGDCALIPEAGGVLALSTDTSVEGVHFRRDWLSPEEIGWRAAAAALSDLAAAAVPALALLAAVTVPADASADVLVAVMRGVGMAAAASGGAVLGGDLSRGSEWSLAISVVGRAERALTRRGSRARRPALGDGRAGRVARRTGALAPGRHTSGCGAPRVRASRAAHCRGGDGWPRWARTRARPQRRARRRRPIWRPPRPSRSISSSSASRSRPVAVAEAQRSGIGAQRFAAEGGEDYELLVALPPSYGERDAVELTHACGVALTMIGDVRAGSGTRFSLHGRAEQLRGWDHFG